jgi:hypothetical protein
VPSARPAARLSAPYLACDLLPHGPYGKSPAAVRSSESITSMSRWIIAGIIAVLVVGDAFTLLALAIVATGWWILSAVEHRVESVGSRANH